MNDAHELVLILPALGLLATGMAVVLVDLYVPAARARSIYEWIAYVGIFASLLGVFWGMSGNEPERIFGGSLVVDKLSRFTALSVLAGLLLTALLSIDNVREAGVPVPEYLALLLIASAGMMFLAMAADLISMFLCVEIMSISIYVLCGITRKDPRSNEASIKYFVQGAFATAILLYGMALLYGATGTVRLDGIARALPGEPGPMALTGIALILAGFAFKIGAAPFHLWVPDVYEGAPTVVTSFMSVAVKAAGFAAMIRLLVVGLEGAAGKWAPMIAAISGLTMLAGNLGAVAQTSVKRMLAYSGIAHTGYALLGLSAFAPDTLSASLFYLFVYTFMTLGAFAFLIFGGLPASPQHPRGREIESYADLAGLAKRRPWSALLMTIFMVSLAGIPPTAGFFGKFMLFKAALANGAVGLSVLGILTSVVGAWYYLRVVVMMYMAEPTEEAAAEAAESGLKVDLNVGIAVGVAALLTVVFGLMPGDYINMARQAVDLLRK